MSDIEKGCFDFAFNAYKTLSTNDKNLVLSPFSLTCALSMTLLGTKDESAAQLSKALFGKQIAVNQLEATVQSLESLTERSIKSNSKVLMNANFLYSHSKYKVLQDFRQTIEKRFSAQSRELDFSSDNNNSIKTINKDVCEATKGKIPQLIESIDSMTRLIIVNCIHFKGFWKSQFKSQITSVQKFRTNSGEEVDIDMMFQENKFPFGYSEELKCKAIELGYESSNTALIVLLPDENSSLQELESKLNSESLNNLINRLFPIKVMLSLPKFKLESNLPLVPSLVKLGIRDIFDDKVANLSGICVDSSGLYVSDVIQKAVIEVNEEGTEAAAATAVMIQVMSLDMTEEFRANRPFMFLMVSKYEEHKNLILFMGSLNNPKL